MEKNKNNNKFVYTEEDMPGITITKKGEDKPMQNEDETKQEETKIVEFDIDNLIFEGANCNRNIIDDYLDFANMEIIKHRFLNRPIDRNTETLIIGTFNPETHRNKATFFYGRSRNFLWKILPKSFGENDLKKSSPEEKIKFIHNYKIDFIDLIEEVIVDSGEGANYDDRYLDKMQIKWRDIITELKQLPNIKRVCFSRGSFWDIPNMNRQIIAIQEYCDANKIYFKRLVTPARFYSLEKQEEWQKFLSK